MLQICLLAINAAGYVWWRSMGRGGAVLLVSQLPSAEAALAADSTSNIWHEKMKRSRGIWRNSKIIG